MIVTGQPKTIDNKIKANQAQYNLDRLAAKLSELFFEELKKYEYLTGEDLVYKPGVIDQPNLIILYWVKFLPRNWIKITKNKGFKRLKRLQNIEDRKKELLNTSTVANKGKNAKNESDFNYDSEYAIYEFNRGFKKFKRIPSLGSKHNELKKFHELLRNFIKNDNATTDETKKHKDKVLNTSHST